MKLIYNYKQKTFLLFSMTAILLVNKVAISQKPIDKAYAENSTMSKNEVVSTEISNYTKLSEDQVKQLTERVTSQRRTVGLSLMGQLGTPNLPNANKTGIIRLLGNIRFEEATAVLIQNINFQEERKDKTKPVLAVGAIQLETSPYTARTALEMIGGTASNTILYTIGLLSKNNPSLPSDFVSSRANGFAEVLYHIEGPRYGLLKLQDRQQEATDPQIKAQYQMVIDRFKKVVAQTQ